MGQKIRILVLGSGGREHALVWKLETSPMTEQVFCIPGNAGIATLAECPQIPLTIETRFAELKAWMQNQFIDLVVVGPEALLVVGVVDELRQAFPNIHCLGPQKASAELEGSKVFTKNFLTEFAIPTARSLTVESIEAARQASREIRLPVVVKADGLAAGKGVWICHSVDQLNAALDVFFVERRYGAATDRVLIEEFLVGEEVSFMALCDGETAIPLASSQDHKRAFDGDEGPNTGGMGAYSPAPALTPDLEARVMREIVEPTMAGMKKRGTPYTGILYAGLMLTAAGPKVLEYNCRLGDPEAQVLLMRLKSDLVDLVGKMSRQELARVQLDWDPRPAVCVVMASGGYPEKPLTGQVIAGLESIQNRPDLCVFHAGTDRQGGQWVSSGGRVLGVTALGADLPAALATVYSAVKQIRWAGAFYRSDIGHRALQRKDAHA